MTIHHICNHVYASLEFREQHKEARVIWIITVPTGVSVSASINVAKPKWMTLKYGSSSVISNKRFYGLMSLFITPVLWQ